MLAVADVIRPESREAIDELHRNHIEVIMITGDARAVADAVGPELGVDQVLRGGAAGGQGQQDRGAPGAGQTGRDGRRRRQRCAGARDRRCRHCHRRRNGRRGRCRRCRPREERPARRPEDHRAEPGELPEDGAEPLVGRRLQRHRHSAGGRRLSHWGFVLSPAAGAVLMSASTIIVALNAQLLRRVTL